MIYEYAIEPEVLCSWDSCRYVSENIGIEHGRLISRFPSKWEKLVHQSLLTSGLSEMTNHRIIEKLASLKKYIIPSHRDYDNQKDWLSNAEHTQVLAPFKAVIAKANPRRKNYVITDVELASDVELWKTKKDDTIQRDAVSLSLTAELLIHTAKELLFIDPHFDPSQRRFRETFIELMSLVNSRKTGANTVSIALISKFNGAEIQFEQDCNRYLKQHLPTGASIIFHRYSELPSGQEFHNRYILTDLGGIRYATGLDTSSNNSSDDVSLLSDNTYTRRLLEFRHPTISFDTHPSCQFSITN